MKSLEREPPGTMASKSTSARIRAKSPPASAPAPTATPAPPADSPAAFYHAAGDRGPRHARFPDINISATAAVYGMSKSQLSRLLNGQNKPSMRSLEILSAILGKSMEDVSAMYQKPFAKPIKKEKEKEKLPNAESIFPGRSSANSRRPASRHR